MSPPCKLLPKSLALATNPGKREIKIHTYHHNQHSLLTTGLVKIWKNLPKSLPLAIYLETYLVKVIHVHKSSQYIPLSVNLPKSLSLAIYLIYKTPVHKCPKCIPFGVNLLFML